MLSNYYYHQYKKFLNRIRIDIWFNLLDVDFKEEYYSKRFIEGKEFDWRNDRSLFGGTYKEASENIWQFGINNTRIEEYFKKYNSLEKKLLDEMSVNLKTLKDYDEFVDLYEDLSNWINEKADRIRYSPEKDLFECSYVEYCEDFKKITFQESYSADIQSFFKELKDRLIQTYCFITETYSKLPFKPDLKWEGYDNELIELITALLVLKKITLKSMRTTRKAVINQFEQLFDIKLKDAESKLSRSSERVNFDDSKILISLQEAYRNYVREKLKK